MGLTSLFKGPKAPSPTATAAAQTGSNVTTAVANTILGNVDQHTPDGSLTTRQTGEQEITDPTTGNVFKVPTFTQTQTLSDHGQALKGVNDQTELGLANLAQSQTDRLRGHLDAPISLDGLPAAGDASSVTDGAEARSRVEAALMERMNPYLDRDRERLRNELSNQGIKQGSEAYDRGMEDFGRQSNDARLGAILNAGGEASRVQSMDLNAFNAANTSRDRALNEELTMRNQPINEVSGLISGAQVNTPQFRTPATGQVANVDFAGLTQANFAAKSQAHNQLLGGLFGLGAAGLAASDIRVKHGVRRVGTASNGLPLYEFSYIGEKTKHIGLMAQDVQVRKPSAVIEMGGVLHVDYDKALEAA